MKFLFQLLFLLFCAGPASLQAGEPATRPNILWFVVDDMSANFSCYGEKLISTPAVDQLAREGTRFTKAFVTAPVCSPCRSALITGMYQTSIGAHHHRSGRGTEKINLPEGVKALPELFQKAGYYTCSGSGLKTDDQAPAKKKRQAGTLGKTDYNFEWNPSIYHSADWSGRRPGQPFFMQVQLAGGKLRGGTDTTAIKLSEQAEKTFGKAVSPADVALPPYYPDDPVIRRDWAAYLDAVRFTDQHVGRVIDRLKKEGLFENTIVIFMTDHGISHARGKQFLYDEGTHIPFIVRGPGVPQNAIRDDLIEHIDMAAISLAFAGIEIPAMMQAKNIMGAEYTPRDAVFAARDRCDETVERIRSVRTGEYLYIRHFYPDRPHLQPNAYKDNKSILISIRALHDAGKLSPLAEKLLFAPTRPPEELYMWKTDRWQLTNLATDPKHAESLKSLRAMLDKWIVDTGDRGPESVKMYDSDMAVYVGNGNQQVEANIRQMKKWAAEGK